MSAPMARAILDGRKTQTRRTVAMREFAPSTTRGYDWTFRDRRAMWNDVSHERVLQLCPYGVPGDRLWVRETHALVGWDGFTHVVTRDGDRVMFRADGAELPDPYDNDPKWRPSIFMPRWASRITLEIAEVRVQRLQGIGAEDVVAEGLGPDDIRCDGECGATPCALAAFTFKRLWDSINGKRAPWSSNPWCWALTFRRVP